MSYKGGQELLRDVGCPIRIFKLDMIKERFPHTTIYHSSPGRSGNDLVQVEEAKFFLHVIVIIL